MRAPVSRPHPLSSQREDEPPQSSTSCGAAVNSSVMATMPRQVRLEPETFERLSEDAARHHENVDSAAERILREHLPADADATSALATLDRIQALRAQMKLGRGAVELVREGRSELERRAS